MSHENADHNALAIVGMSCRFPGAANTEQFWNLILNGQSGISEIPVDRLDPELYFDPKGNSPGKSWSKIAGIVPVQPIDPHGCSLSESQISQADDVHLMMCEVVWQAVRDAGFHPETESLSSMGLYLGNSSGSNLEADLTYHAHAEEIAEWIIESCNDEKIPLSTSRTIANTISTSIRKNMPSWSSHPCRNVSSFAAAKLIVESLRLQGPYHVIDAACATSFFALNQARLAIVQGRIDQAIVGAFSFRNWYEMILLSPTQSIGHSHSAPFSQHAEGMIPADGYAAVVIMPLERAIEEQRTIHGVIRSMGLSSDGRGKSVWAPQQAGQIAAIRRAYRNGIDPQSVQFIEAHATSTQLGDLTEMLSLQECFSGFFPQKIPVSSVKANIGHTLEVAGLASLIKTLLMMRHRVIPPALNAVPLNSKIPWDQLPFSIPIEVQNWNPPAEGDPLRAGIDSFGIGGLNVHIVVESAPQIKSSTGLAPKSQIKQNTDPIAVVGVSIPLAEDEMTTQLLELCESDQLIANAPSPEYQFDWKKYRIPPKQITHANSLQFLMLDAAVKALEDAELLDADFDRTRVATVVGTRFTNDFSCDTFVGARLPELLSHFENVAIKEDLTVHQIDSLKKTLEEQMIACKPAIRDVTASLSSSTLASMISKHLDLMGGAFSVDAGEQTVAAALLSALDLLESEDCEIVLCVVGQWMTDVSFQQQHQNGIPISLGRGACAVLLMKSQLADQMGKQVKHRFSIGVQNRLHNALSRRWPPTESKEKETSSQNRMTRQESLNICSDTHLPIPDDSQDYSPELICQLMTDWIADYTGFPKEIIHADSRLVNDLNLAIKTQQLLIQELEHKLPGNVSLSILFKEDQTLGQFSAEVTRLLGQRESSSASFPSGNSIVARGNPSLLRRVEVSRTRRNSSKSIWKGAVLIVGRNEVANALKSKLESNQQTVYQYYWEETPAYLLEQLDQLLSQEVVPHLFLVSHPSESSLKKRNVASQSTVKSNCLEVLSFQICQRWFAHVRSRKLIDLASLVAVTALGGDFGIRSFTATSHPSANGSPNAENLMSAGWSGLLKSLRNETSGRLHVRSFDVPLNEPVKMVVTTITQEMLRDREETELASVRGKLYVPRLIPEERTTEAEDCSSSNVSASGNWIITGALSNTTFQMMLELGILQGSRFHIVNLGAAPEIDPELLLLSEQELRWKVMREAKAEGFSPAKLWQEMESQLRIDAELKSLRNDGVDYCWHQCDFEHPSECQKQLPLLWKSNGQITGIIHTIVKAPASRFEKKTREQLEFLHRENIVIPNLILNSIPTNALQQFVILTESFNRNGTPYQTATAVSEATLSQLMRKQLGQSNTKLSVLHFPSVNQIETKSLSRKDSETVSSAETASAPSAMSHGRIQDILKLCFHSPAEVNWFVAPELHPAQAANSTRDSHSGRHRESKRFTVRNAPLIERIFAGEVETAIAEIIFDPARDPFLKDHLHEGVPLLPTVAGIEACFQAAAIWTSDSQCIIQNLHVHNGFRMSKEMLYHAQVHLFQNDQKMTAVLTGDYFDKEGQLADPYRKYQSCEIPVAQDMSKRTLPDLGALASSWMPIVYGTLEQEHEISSGTITYGATLRTLKEAHFEANSAWGKMIAPEVKAIGGERTGSLWISPVALLDGALFLGDLLGRHLFESRQLPRFLKRIELYRLPQAGEECLVHCKFKERKNRLISFDFWIIGKDDEPILIGEGYELTMLKR